MAHGWHQQDVSLKLDEIGWPMDRTALGKIETGTRNVTLEDFLALSAALGVEPAALLLPPEDDTDVAVTPVLNAPAWRVRSWLHGYQPVTNWDDEIDTRFFTEQVSNDEWRARRVGMVDRLRWAAYGLERAAAHPEEPETIRDALEIIVNLAQHELDALPKGH
jgi:transcriptional regulator with XRE-family HTH domain